MLGNTIFRNMTAEQLEATDAGSRPGWMREPALAAAGAVAARKPVHAPLPPPPPRMRFVSPPLPPLARS